MGAERLKFVVLGAALVVGCASSPPAAPTPRVSLVAPVGARGAHFEILRAMTTKARIDIVERFRAKNGAAWTITIGAGGAPDDVDPLFGIVRRAKREDEPSASPSRVAVDEAGALAEGTRFVAHNAEFFGLTANDVATLDVEASPARNATHGPWVVHVRGERPSRGYEGFANLTSKIDALLYVGDDGRVRMFVNVSRVHPRLTLDTKPLLGPDDPRVTRNVVGRELYLAIDDARRPGTRVRDLKRLSLGRVTPDDVRASHLTIHVSPGPREVYVTYQLAYAIDVVRQHQSFRFIVDADTGGLLEDAVVPIVTDSVIDLPDGDGGPTP